MKAYFKEYNLEFNKPAGTSKGYLEDRKVWYLIIEDEFQGIGECAPLKNFSIDFRDDYKEKINQVCKDINKLSFQELVKIDLESYLELSEFPTILFGLETAINDYSNSGKRIIFNNLFIHHQGIKINGLIWMGNIDYLESQIDKKLAEGFKCIKLKIGINFDTELAILKKLRDRDKSLEIRVDANGAYKDDVRFYLDILKELNIHSIEQPIAVHQHEFLKELCKDYPIALDEELFSFHRIYNFEEKLNLLKTISPKYIVLKPSMLGGFKHTNEWIQIAESLKIGWWITSFLESNIGLNALCQYAKNFKLNTYQGLGTGMLYKNNIPSPLEIKNSEIIYGNNNWDLRLLD